MDTPTEPKAWRTVLDEQGRQLRWLADQTGKSRRTVYAYSRGDLIPPDEWLEAVSELLGERVGHLSRRVA
jgi:predicted transcriptional regulator